MRLLLDTNVVIRLLDGRGRLSAAAREAVADPGNAIVVSVVTPWEAGIKQAQGRLWLPGPLPGPLAGGRYELLPITPAHARAAPALPPHHRDPFDRMLVAQALVEGLTLVTSDRALAAYDVPLLLA